MNFPPRPSATQSPYDFTPPDPEAERKRRRGQQVGLLMAFLLLALLLHGLFQRDTGFTAAEATRLEKIEMALQNTKLVFGDRAENGQQSLNRNAKVKPLLPTESYRKEEDAVLKKWQEIANLNGAHPSDLRRLGLAMAVFGKPEARAIFQKIPELYAQHTATFKKNPKVNVPKKKSREAEELDEEYIWKQLIPPKQETALWNAVYGTTAIRPEQIPALRKQVQSLELQWFEPVVLADLYAKANLTLESRRSEEAALTSVHYLQFFDQIETTTRLLGLPAAFLFFYWFLRKPNSTSRALLLQNVPTPKIPTAFSYHSRMVAFVAYMALPLVIFLPFSLIKSQLRTLSATSLTRLEALLEICGSLLIAGIAVLILRRVDASDRAEETGERRPASIRETLYQLGYRSRNFPQDVVTGFVGYPATMFVTLFAALLSYWLFQKFHTPPHPVLLSVAGLHTPFDRGLLFVESAVVPPLVEELMFRGLLYPALRERWGIAGGIALSAAVFALVHPTLPGGFLPLWTMGAIWAFTYERRGSLIPGILMHALNNGLLIAMDFSALSK